MALTAVSPESGNEFVDSFINNGRHYVNSPGVTGPFVINYYFDKLDGPVTSDGRGTGYDWRPFEKGQWQAAVKGWENVANVRFNQVSTREAALFRERLEDQATAGGTVSASHSLPSASTTAQSLGTYNFEAVNVRQWTPDQLEPGGNFYRTFIHETGHGLGLKHPHDSGSGAFTPNYFPGIDPSDSSAERQRSLGVLQLNHMFGSVMSYIHGYEFNDQGRIEKVPTRQRPVADDFFLDHGFAATPMAYDVAAIQYLYGANTTYRSGNNVYVLPDSNDPHPFVRGEPNEAGVPESIVYQPDTAFWECIWDTGGTDEMRSDGARSAILDLTAATLDQTVTGAGVLSYAAFIGGGYTIANGVVIENATGGEGGDLITGNAAGNVLLGRGGDDTFTATAGDDRIDGGTGSDTVVFGGTLASYSASTLADRFVIGTASGSTTASNVELLRFADGDLAPTSNGISGGLDELYYLSTNPDVFAAKANAQTHYDAYGWREGRNPDAFFDTTGYLATYDDVAAAGVNPLTHYLTYGWTEGRDPSTRFDGDSYLAAYSDVRAAGVNPLVHYLAYGRAEGRDAFADGNWT